MFKNILLLEVAVFACISISNQQLTKLNEKYYASDIQLEFVRSYAVCKRNGLIFATEQNQKDTDAINALLVARQRSNQGFWLGGLNETIGDLDAAEWVWMDLYKKISEYTQWGKDEPRGPSGCNCMLRHTDGLWYAEPCSNIHYFLCQEP